MMNLVGMWKEAVVAYSKVLYVHLSDRTVDECDKPQVISHSPRGHSTPGPLE